MQRNLFSEFACFSPDEGGAAGGTTAAAATTAADAGAASTTTDAAPAVAAAGAATTAATTAGAATTTAAAPAAPSWLESLKGAGLPVGKDESETIAALKQLNAERQAFEQVRHLLPHVQQYIGQATEFNKWRESQRQGTQAAPAAAKNPNDPWWKAHWQPPEYNANWLSQVVKDANGNLVPAPGAPADVVSKLQTYQQFRTEQAEKLLNNPFEFFQPMQQQIEERARAIAQEVIDKTLGNTQARQNATNFIQQNSSWLFEVDPATKAIKKSQAIDPTTGQWVETEVLTPWGEKMKTYADQVRQSQQQRGYFDQREIEQLAFAQVQRDYAIWELGEIRAGRMTVTPSGAPGGGAPGATGATTTPQAAANQAFLDKNNPAGQGGKKGAPNEPKPITTRTLRAELLRAFKEAGLTDESLRQ